MFNPSEAIAAVPPLVLTGDSAKDHVARQEHHAALTAFYDKNPPKGLAPGAYVPDALPARQTFTKDTGPGGEGTPAQRAAASAPAPVIDQAYADALTKHYRGLPEAERDRVRADFERELAEVFSGRKKGESRADFEARTAPAAADPAATSPGEPIPQAQIEAAVDTLHKATDHQGFADAKDFPSALTSGYTLPAGYKYNAAEAVRMLKFARSQNLSQAQIEAYVADQLAAVGKK